MSRLPYGFKIKKRRNSTGQWVDHLVPDPEWRALGAQLLAWRRQGYTFKRIYFHLLEHRIFKPDGTEYSLDLIIKYIRKETELQEKEAPAVIGF